MKIVVAGDFCQKYRVDKAIKERRFAVLFDEVKPFIESADYSIVNFEFPIVMDSKVAKPLSKYGPNLQGTIEALDALKYAGFDCCTLANNHILDQGEQSCLDTKRVLEESGIDTVGAGANLQEASKVLYKQIDGESLAIINCCEHEFTIATDITAGANPLNPIQQYYIIKEAKLKADYVLVIVHGGHEHFQLPSPRMQETYRFFIDAGADTVVNHHQHCYSGYEVYRCKPIFYGLGNFCFDHLKSRNDIWNEGYIATMDFNKDQITFDVTPYTQCQDFVGVKFMSDKTNFYERINQLNNIINDPLQLPNSVKAYYSESECVFESLYQPYENRLLSKLYRLGLLPSLLSKKRMLKILNYMECESHRDKQLYAISMIVKKRK